MMKKTLSILLIGVISLQASYLDNEIEGDTIESKKFIKTVGLINEEDDIFEEKIQRSLIKINRHLPYMIPNSNTELVKVKLNNKVFTYEYDTEFTEFEKDSKNQFRIKNIYKSCNQVFSKMILEKGYRYNHIYYKQSEIDNSYNFKPKQVLISITINSDTCSMI